MQVLLSKDAQKQFKKLPENEQLKVKRKLLTLKQDPQAGKKLAGELKDFRSLKVWPYRILYEINTLEKRIEIHKIAHRQSAYK